MTCAASSKLDAWQDSDYNQYVSLEDFGCTVYQDEWDRSSPDRVSQVVQFTSPISFQCPSVEDGHSLAAVPGVCGTVPMEKGLYVQPILCKGSYCYTLTGLVGSDEEKRGLKNMMSWANHPFVGLVGGIGSRNGPNVATLHVDMVNRRAELYRPTDYGNYIAGTAGNEEMRNRTEPFHVWENLPPKVWVCVAMKRNNKTEAVLLPCSHWNLEEINA